MAIGNLGFGQRFNLGEAYSPTLGQQGQQGMVQMQPTSMGVQPLQMGGGQPSLLDVQMSQQQNPGGLLGFGNNTDNMVGAQQGSTNWGALAQQGLGLLAQTTGGGGGGQQGPALPPPPNAPAMRAPQNDKLAQLLAQYGIQGV